jgi:hypothetical protein
MGAWGPVVGLVLLGETVGNIRNRVVRAMEQDLLEQCLQQVVDAVLAEKGLSAKLLSNQVSQREKGRRPVGLMDVLAGTPICFDGLGRGHAGSD